MALNDEWLRRIGIWRDELPRYFYRELGPVHLGGFSTCEQLTAAEALQRDFTPLPAGTRWGAKWEYAWTGRGFPHQAGISTL